MEANIKKILNNHLHQMTAAFQSSLRASHALHPPVPVPEPNPPQPLPPPSSHGAPPSRSHRTSTSIHRHRRSRSPRHSRHRSQHRRPHPHHHRTPQRHRRRSTSPPKSTSRQGCSRTHRQKHRRTLSADRRRSPRREPSRRGAPFRREAQSAPPQTAYLTSVAPRRPSHSDKAPVRLTPNKYPDNPKMIPAPPARGVLAPLPPPSTPPAGS